MARLIDLEEDSTPAKEASSGPPWHESYDAITSHSKVLPSGVNGSTHGVQQPSSGVDRHADLISSALACYPIASQLAGCLDLNSLHDLSRTCSRVRASLLQNHTLLKNQTLHCENEKSNPAQRLGNALHASFQVWTAYGQNGTKVGRITSGKLGTCSRDMVSGCRRCGKIVCRNCIMKPPLPTTHKGRLRRLCRTCMKSPLSNHTRVSPTAASSSLDSLGPPHSDHELDLSDETPDASPLVVRTPCSCPQQIWICQPCSQTLRSNDTSYMRSWAWRARYSTCGGIGAGLGEGNEGVECGRNNDFKCLGAREVEQEVECETERAVDEQQALPAGWEDDLLFGGGGGADAQRHWQGSSYMTHEIVGIGGKVKKKVRMVVNVGEIVKEYEDERMFGKFLEREQSGANRSWCSWCARVVPGKKDMDRESGSTTSLDEDTLSPLYKTLSVGST